MRLLKPSPGEVADRLGILSLKIVASKAQGRDIKNFEDERLALADYLKLPEGVVGQVNLAMNELDAVNEKLWKLEDEIRDLKKQWETTVKGWSGFHWSESERAIEVAFLIPELNDKRAQLIKDIDALYGIETNEKVYK